MQKAERRRGPSPPMQSKASIAPLVSSLFVLVWPWADREHDRRFRRALKGAVTAFLQPFRARRTVSRCAQYRRRRANQTEDRWIELGCRPWRRRLPRGAPGRASEWRSTVVPAVVRAGFARCRGDTDGLERG